MFTHILSGWVLHKLQWNLSATCSLSISTGPQSWLRLKHILDPLWVLTEFSQELVSRFSNHGTAEHQPGNCLKSCGCSAVVHFFIPRVLPAFPFGHFTPIFYSKSLSNLLLHTVLKNHLLVFLLKLLLYSTFYVQPLYPLFYPNPRLLFTWLLSQAVFLLPFCLNPYSQTLFP